MSDDVLARICDDKARHVESRKAIVSLSDLEQGLAEAPPPRGFRQALLRKHEECRPALIAEIKKASPSKGLIRADFDPPELAKAYKAGGAACLSVLTDRPYFQGEDEYIAAVRSAVDLPVLRKDFMIDPYQVVEARFLGADCILVILAAVDDSLAQDLIAESIRLGMDYLVEVHDRVELERALALCVPLIGINNRNLKTLSIDLATTEDLISSVPDHVTVVCESGLYTNDDLERMRKTGVSTFLVGESLMRQDDVEGATRKLLGPWGR